MTILHPLYLIPLWLCLAIVFSNVIIDNIKGVYTPKDNIGILLALILAITPIVNIGMIILTIVISIKHYKSITNE